MNTAGPIGNIPNRLDNHGVWINKPGRSKSRTVLFTTCPAAVNHAGFSAKGFDWLSVSRRILKTPKPVSNQRQFKRSISSVGLL
jgi:transposase